MLQVEGKMQQVYRIQNEAEEIKIFISVKVLVPTAIY